MGDDFKPGDIIADKFRVERELGEGGMAYVLEVTHLHLDERAAIKLLRSEVLHHGSVTERFAREARAMIKLKSEHVARVLDVGALPSGSPFMVMEFLEGVDLAEHLAARGAFAPSDAVDMILQVCDAIAEAHARGIVHRDLKPANLFLVNRPDGSPSVKVLDFGISKIANSAMPSGSLSLTKTSALLGSPLYMAPEQIASAKDADTRADTWGLGTVLYELIAGHPPFEGETLSRLQHQILREPPTPLTNSVPSISPELEAVVLKCLAKDPDERFQDMAAFARALGPFASKRGAHYVDRVAGIVSRAGTLSTTSRNRTERLRAVSNPSRNAAAVTPDGATEEAEPRPTVTYHQAEQGAEVGSISASAAPIPDRIGTGTEAAWIGTPSRRAARSRVGLVVATVLGSLAAVILAVAAVRYVSPDTAPPPDDSARVAAATGEPGIERSPDSLEPERLNPDASLPVAVEDVNPPATSADGRTAGTTRTARPATTKTSTGKTSGASGTGKDPSGSKPPKSEGGLFETRK